MKLSLIIPVYNVEAYLEQCLNSCIHQDLPVEDYEIIIVNDGSPDNSLSIIKDFVRKCTNIVVINKENGGLSSARNAGLSIAQGDYIWFVDSDDWIKDNCLGQILALTKESPEIITLNTFLIKDCRETIITRNLSHEILLKGEEVYTKSWVYPFSAVQFYIFKRSFIFDNSLFFKEGIYFEDLLFTSEALSIASNCISYSIPVYYYRIRSNSITSSGISEKKVSDMFIVMNSQYEWMCNIGCCNIHLMSDSICKTANELFRRYILKLNKKEREKWCYELRAKKYWLSCVKSSGSIKNHIYYTLFCLFCLKERI